MVSLKQFEHQIISIQKIFSIVPLATFLEKPSCSEKPFASLTFDDGYANVYNHAYPLLKSLNIPFSVFIPTKLVLENKYLPQDRIYVAFLNTKRRRISLSSEWAGMIKHPVSSNKQTFSTVRPCMKSLGTIKLEEFVCYLERELGTTIIEDPVWSREAKLLDIEMINEMSRSGIVEFGAHTRTHVRCSSLKTNEEENEIIGSVKDIE